MIRTQIQLTEEQMLALKEIANERDVSVAEIIRQSVDMYLNSSPRISNEERRKRALAVIGRFHSEGPGDVSTRHDDYLDEIYGTW